MEMTRKTFPDGLTVKELKALIKDWPETNADGEPTEVWIGDGRNLSNLVRDVTPLNLRTNDAGHDVCDILFDLRIPE